MQTRIFLIPKSALYLLVLFLIMVFIDVRSTQANPDACSFHNISGWAWSSNIGWVSLSCWNTGPGQAGPDYGLDISGNTISGWAWSFNIGWICFGTSCSGTAPDGSSPLVTYDSGIGAVSGWGRIISLGDDGWLKLRKAAGDAGADYGVTLQPDLTLTGFAWNANTTSGVGIGWLKLGAVAGGVPQCNDTIDNDSDGKIDYPADECCLSAEDPTEDNWCGVGVAWVQTLYQDIYAKGELSSLFYPALSQYSATYLIMSDNSIRKWWGVSTWRSAGPMEQSGTLASDWERENLPAGEQILFPQESGGVYENILGKIDYLGLITDVGGNKNKYGNNIRTNINPLEQNGQFNNDVYHIISDLNFPSDDEQVDFVNNSGPGIIVVDGTLTLTATTTYDTAVISDLEDLASVTWIIKGDVIIEPDVGTSLGNVGVVGNFIVLGDGSPATCPALDQPSAGCGRVSTGTTGESAIDNKLIIQGLIIARQFKFERLFAGATGEPAEQVIFDGRLFANPPEAMRDLLKALPVWQEVGP